MLQFWRFLNHYNSLEGCKNIGNKHENNKITNFKLLLALIVLSVGLKEFDNQGY